jgi:hypothetical protein
MLHTKKIHLPRPWLNGRQTVKTNCRFCGSNTVPPEIAFGCGTRSELQSGALPGELKRLHSWYQFTDCRTRRLLQLARFQTRGCHLLCGRRGRKARWSRKVVTLMAYIILYLQPAVPNKGLAPAHHTSVLAIRSNKSTTPSPSSTSLTSATSTTSRTASTTNAMQSASRPTKRAEPALLFARHDFQVRTAQVEPLALALGVVATDHVAVRAT